MTYINKSIFPIGVNKPGTDTVFLAGKISNLMPVPQTGSVYYQRTKHLRSNPSLATQNVFSYNAEINTTLPGIENPQQPIPSPNYNLELVFDDIANANTLVGGASNLSNWNTFFDLPNYGNPFTSVTINGNSVLLNGGYNIETKFGLFANYLHLLEVIDQGALVTLGDQTFSGITSLTSISALNVTTTICESTIGVFGDCVNINSVYLPNCVNLGAYTFFDCYNLPSSNLTLPFDQITSIGEHTFDSCNSLTEINYPVLTSIGNNAFQQCTGLTSINLPLVEYIGIASFLASENINSINLPLLTQIDSLAFYDCTSLVSISTPNVTTIGNVAFRNCVSASIFNFPNALYVVNGAFISCSSATYFNLSSCIYLGDTVQNDEVFGGISGSIMSLTVPTALMTCWAGNPDGDIQYLQANNTVTIVTV
jgi:hypothetical protein